MNGVSRVRNRLGSRISLNKQQVRKCTKCVQSVQNAYQNRLYITTHILYWVVALGMLLSW